MNEYDEALMTLGGGSHTPGGIRSSHQVCRGRRSISECSGKGKAAFGIGLMQCSPLPGPHCLSDPPLSVVMVTGLVSFRGLE